MGSCDCSCDYADFFEKVKKKANKTHICIECLSEISPNEFYWLHVGIWEGKWEKFKLCEFCENALIDLFAHKDFDCKCLAYGDLWEYEELINEMKV